MKFENAFFEAAFGTAAQLPESDLPEIVFSGRSNVGKSSLINKIFNRKALAKVSSSPGKTATINFYNVDSARLVDLPGYGYAKVSGSERLRWAKLMDGYFAGNRNIALVVQLVDMRHPATKLDNDMLNYLSQIGLPFIIAMTKCDKLNKGERAKRLSAIDEELSFINPVPEYIPVSSATGEGIEELKKRIINCVEE